MDLTKNIAIISFIVLTVQLHAQWGKKAEVANVKLMFVNEKVEITYDILSSKNEKFFISVNIYNQEHNKLNAKSIYGDVDTLVSSGINKKITWDIKKDYPLFDEDIYAEINAMAVHNLDLKKAFLYSTIFPGLGSYKLTGSKYFLLNGVLFYGCISASILLANKSKQKYNSYKHSYTINERNTLFEQAYNNRKFSINLFYAGTGLLVINYGLTYLNLKKSEKKYRGFRYSNLSINFIDYETPVISYKIEF